MVEIKEIEGKDYGKDLVEVVRCKDCIWSEGMESSRYVRCTRLYELVPVNAYCSNGRAVTKARFGND